MFQYVPVNRAVHLRKVSGRQLARNGFGMVHSATTPIIRHIPGGVDVGVGMNAVRKAVWNEGVGWRVEVAVVNTEYERQREERVTL